jgi:hypothetical protein
VAPSRADAFATLFLLSLALGSAGCSLTLASDAELSGGSHDAGPAGSYRSTILADKPLAYWRLGEAVGGTTAHDETGNNHDGAYSTSCVLGVAGALPSDSNTAVQFDGNAASVTVDPPGPLDFEGHTPFSVEGWVKPARIGGGYQHAINHESPTGVREGYAVFVDDLGNLDFERFVGSQGLTLRGPLVTMGQWYHVVGTYDTSTLRLYVNGALIATTPDGRSANALADPLYLGLGGGNMKFFQGVIDEVAIYGAALTQAQITAHYKASGRGP